MKVKSVFIAAIVFLVLTGCPTMQITPYNASSSTNVLPVEKTQKEHIIKIV